MNATNSHHNPWQVAPRHKSSRNRAIPFTEFRMHLNFPTSSKRKAGGIEKCH